MNAAYRFCELCHGEAAVYCSSDSAFLCSHCDARVHSANFLVARHVRRTLCSHCQDFDGRLFSGDHTRQLPCRSCSHPGSYGPTKDHDHSTVDALSSSACISSNESSSATKKIDDLARFKSPIILSSSSGGVGDEVCSKYSRLPEDTKSRKGVDVDQIRKTRRSRSRAVDYKAEGVLVNWCRKLGRGGMSGSSSEVVVQMAWEAFAAGFDSLTVLPNRVGLAASLWFSLRLLCKMPKTTRWQDLKRLEEISGVPAKLIVAAESKLSRSLKIRRPRRHHQLLAEEEEEGWAEC